MTVELAPQVEPTSEELDALLGVDRTARLSLVSKGTYLPLNFSNRCPRSVGKTGVLNLETGQVRPAVCKANWCPYCVKVKRWNTARAVGASRPSAFLTFTLVGDEWPVIQRTMNKIRERLVRQDYDFEWAYKVECNLSNVNGKHVHHHLHRGHAHHVHAYLHGENIPDQGTFGVEAERRGLGSETHLLLLKDDPERAPRYLWGWGEKIHEIHPLNLPHHLGVNGGRVVHSSRNFWRYRREHKAGMRAVLKALNAERRRQRMREFNL